MWVIDRFFKCHTHDTFIQFPTTINNNIKNVILLILLVKKNSKAHETFLFNFSHNSKNKWYNFLGVPLRFNYKNVHNKGKTTFLFILLFYYYFDKYVGVSLYKKCLRLFQEKKIFKRNNITNNNPHWHVPIYRR